MTPPALVADGATGVERRRVAVIDGATRLELSLATDVVVLDGVARQGLTLVPGSQALVGRDGVPIPAGLVAAELRDGAVLTLVDLHTPLRGATPREDDPDRAGGALAAWWLMAAVAVALLAADVLVPDALTPTVRLAAASAAAIAAFAAAVVWTMRRATARRGAPVASALLLAFAAGVVVVPPMVGGAVLAVAAGLGLAAVLAALLSVTAVSPVVRAGAATAATMLVLLTLIWGGALLLGLPMSGPAAVSLGLAPVALRMLPTTLLDVPPGMFLEFRRFQTSRWSVRQQLPPEVGPLGAAEAGDLVARSSSRLLSGTALVSLVAAAVAPIALPSFDPADPVVFGGRIALAACALLALLLGARRSSAAAIRWFPRLAALAVAAATLAALVPAASPLVLTLVAGVLLALGVAVAFGVAPAARGSRSLFWSRLGDRVEGLAVALSLPAGLVAADAIDLLRGWVGS